MLLLNKTLPLIVSPIGLTLLIAAASLLLKRPRGVWLALGLLWVFSMPVVGHHLMRAAEGHALRLNAAEMPQAEAIVVLGGLGRSVPNAQGGLSREWNDAADRFEAGLELWRAQRAPRLVFTAGRLPWDLDAETEGQWLARRAEAAGVPRSAIMLTAEVQNTADEARAVAALPFRQVLLVTSAFHMPRARAQFEAQGLSVTPFAVDFRASPRALTVQDFLPEAGALEQSSTAVREAVGRVFYALRKELPGTAAAR